MWTEHFNFSYVVLHISGCHLNFRCCSFFLLVKMSLLSSWDELDVCGKLLADDIWASEDDKTGLLSFGVDIFYQSYLK